MIEVQPIYGERVSHDNTSKEKYHSRTVRLLSANTSGDLPKVLSTLISQSWDESRSGNVG